MDDNLLIQFTMAININIPFVDGIFIENFWQYFLSVYVMFDPYFIWKREADDQYRVPINKNKHPRKLKIHVKLPKIRYYG